MNYKLETYEDMVGLALIALKQDEIFVIEHKVKIENREKFVQIVKNYIDKNFGHNEGWDIEFNSDYSKIHKTYFHNPKPIIVKQK